MRRTRTPRAQKPARTPRTPRSRAARELRVFDAYRSFPAEYRATAHPSLIEVSPATYLAIDGMGDPNGQGFADAVGALYATAYALAMTRQRAGRPSFHVPHLEGLWHAKSEAEFMAEPRDAWCWTLLVRIPDFITADEVVATTDSMLGKGRTPAIAGVRRLLLEEGKCVQVLHTGAYDREPATIARVNAHLDELDLVRHGSHHEIYLSDPRSTPPEKLKTILRHPVRLVGAES